MTKTNEELSLKITTAEKIKEKFLFLLNSKKDWVLVSNIAYHFQYLEYLYIEQKKLTLTLKSLLIKTIIIEFAIIIEAILYNLLKNKKIHVSGVEMELFISDYCNFESILKNSKHYKIINNKVFQNLQKLKKFRNEIHIYNQKNAKEIQKYDEKTLKECENIFEDSIIYIWKLNNVEHNDFKWPHK